MGKLFYGTQTGTTDDVANRIQKALPEYIDEVKCIIYASPADFEQCDFLVLGGSTWGDGELTDDWVDFLPRFEALDLSGKAVALFGLGDQYGYGYNFVSAMKVLYDITKKNGARIIADTISLDGFDYEHSESVVDGCFIGLAVDEVNQPELTDDRIANWAALVRAQAKSAVTAG
ncbi:MAG: flavodoxin [Candidatus Melainabacteria bacterium]|nr:flavodoxin [Candidatus Melainabacteria bacterium]